jgi:hypothetical protein
MGQRDDDTGRHFHGTEDLPTGRGPGKVVTTDILRDPVNTLLPSAVRVRQHLGGHPGWMATTPSRCK